MYAVVLFGGLAVLAVAGGFIGVVNVYNSQFKPDAESLSIVQQILEPIKAPVGLACGLGAVVVGFLAAFSLYKNAATDPLPAKLGPLATAMKNRFYFDEIYEATFIRAHDAIAWVAAFVDRWILEGVVIGGVRGGTDIFGRGLRLLQSGNLQWYAFMFVTGVAVVLYWVLVFGK